MPRQLHKALLRYYKQLHSVHNEWLITRDQIRESIQVLVEQIEAFQHIREYDNEEVDEQVYRAVTCQLFAALCEEQNHLFKFIAKLNHITQDLKDLLHNVIQARSKVSMSDEKMNLLIKGSHCLPKLDSLMKWAIQSYEYFKQMFQNIYNQVILLDPNKVQTTDKLIAAIEDSEEKKLIINNILCCTQYMIDEEFPPVKHKDIGIKKSQV